jgi:hypothetical protein|tara:strand:+ start:3947 stop:4204 length:258 start_codon:yes stop_codon:yes gene_type:complete
LAVIPDVPYQLNLSDVLPPMTFIETTLVHLFNGIQSASRTFCSSKVSSAQPPYQPFEFMGERHGFGARGFNGRSQPNVVGADRLG